MRYFLALCFLWLTSPAYNQEIREFMDMQIHTTMHIPYGFFGDGLTYFDEDDPPKLKHKHQFKNVNYANFFERNAGARIFINGTILPELIASKKRAKRLTLEQIRYLEDFVAAHADDFAIAKTPAEVRKLVHTTDKTIFIHSIEGAKRLINSAEDAQFWADQGVAFVTLMHLVDSEHGAAGIKPGLMPALINFKGTFKRLFGAGKKRGLKEKGKQAIRWLAQAGIMTDITHMSELTRTDALELMEAENIPLISTHDLYRPIQNHTRGLTPSDMERIYRSGGFIALPLSGMVLKPHRAEPEYEQQLVAWEDYCPGSVDDFKFTYLAVKTLLEDELSEKLYNRHFSALSEEEKVHLSLGFQSDFNGWLNHSRPRYGKKGCLEVSSGQQLTPFQTQGLVHPGFIGAFWNTLEQENVELAPLKRASERFLQLWQQFLDHRISPN